MVQPFFSASSETWVIIVVSASLRALLAVEERVVLPWALGGRARAPAERGDQGIRPAPVSRQTERGC